jgi:hypothetical protein
MAAPTPTNRIKPPGKKTRNGWRTLITLAFDPDIAFFEKEVTPSGIDNGQEIDVSDQHNLVWEQSAPRGLKKQTPVTIQAGYIANDWDDIIAACGVETVITETAPDASQLSYYGFLKSAVRGPHVNGTQPMCTIVIVPTNTDPNTGSEEAPVLTGGGTGG